MKDIKCKYIISFGIKDNIIVAIVALLFDTAAYFMYRQGTAVFMPFGGFGGLVSVLFVDFAEDGSSVLNSWICTGVWPCRVNGQNLDRMSSDNTLEDLEFSVDQIEKI